MHLEPFVKYGKPEHHACFFFGQMVSCKLRLQIPSCSLALSKFSIDDLLPMVVLTSGSVVIITVVPVVIPIQVT